MTKRKGGNAMFGIGSRLRLSREIEQEQKEQKENQLKWYHYLLSALFVLSGAVFIGYTEISIQFICRFLAFVFLAAGVISIVLYCFKDVATEYYRLELVYGVMSIFAAVLFLTKQQFMEEYFTVIAGCILFGNGVIKLQHSIDMKRIDRKMKKVTEMWLVVMMFALMCIAAGSVAVYLTTAEDRTMFLFIGISFVVAGITDVITHIVFNGKVRMFKSGKYLTEEPEAKSKDEKEPESAAIEPEYVVSAPVAAEHTVTAEDMDAQPEESSRAEDGETGEQTEDAGNTEDAADKQS